MQILKRALDNVTAFLVESIRDIKVTVCSSTKAHKASFCCAHHAYEQRISHNTREVAFYLKEIIVNSSAVECLFLLVLTSITVTLRMDATTPYLFTNRFLQELA